MTLDPSPTAGQAGRRQVGGHRPRRRWGCKTKGVPKVQPQVTSKRECLAGNKMGAHWGPFLPGGGPWPGCFSLWGCSRQWVCSCPAAQRGGKGTFSLRSRSRSAGRELPQQDLNKRQQRETSGCQVGLPSPGSEGPSCCPGPCRSPFGLWKHVKLCRAPRRLWNWSLPLPVRAQGRCPPERGGAAGLTVDIECWQKWSRFL